MNRRALSLSALLYGVNALTVAAGFAIVVYWSVVKRATFPDEELRITIVSKDGTVEADTATDEPLENHLDRPEIVAALHGEESTLVKRRSTVTGDDVMYYAMPIKIKGEAYALRLASPLRRMVYYTRGTRRSMAAQALAVALAVLLLTFLESRYIVRSINELSALAIKVRQDGFDFDGIKGTQDARIKAPMEVLLLRDDIESMAREVKRLEKVRKDFVANVSHELRTPVTAIIGFSETLLELEKEAGEGRASSEDALHFLNIINAQGKRLMAIIEDLLTLSRLEKDSRRPEMMRCDLSALTRRVVETFSSRGAERSMHLAFASNGGSSVFCMANERLYEEALGNIIDNAIKYCPEGSHIDCSVESTSGTVRVTVEDDGAGIPEELRERIFERFYRVDKGRSRDMGGTGLGLSIASHIIKAHGGSLTARGRSDGKQGAVFVIEMPSVP